MKKLFITINKNYIRIRMAKLLYSIIITNKKPIKLLS